MRDDYPVLTLGPEQKPLVPETTSDHDGPAGKGWDGPTYYGRSQLKPAPFNPWVVGGYIFLAGLSGASALLASAADLRGGGRAEGTARRGRYLSMLAPALGSALLIWDLHTPKRFYNMLRVAKHTSPMSIGTWILMSFSTFAGLGAVAQFGHDKLGWRWLRNAAKAVSLPAAVTGAGLSTYTASLLAATSTPLWAAQPEALSIRFGASSVAASAAALSLGEPSPDIRRTLDTIAIAALAAEFAATYAGRRDLEAKNVQDAAAGAWGRTEKTLALGLGVMLPLGFYAASRIDERRPGRVSTLASLAVLAGSAMFRISMLGAGAESARRPDVSFRFSQPDNLPQVRRAEEKGEPRVGARPL